MLLAVAEVATHGAWTQAAASRARTGQMPRGEAQPVVSRASRSRSARAPQAGARLSWGVCGRRGSDRKVSGPQAQGAGVWGTGLALHIGQKPRARTVGWLRE